MVIRSTKLTGRILAKAIGKLLKQIAKQKTNSPMTKQPKEYKGKQTVKQLVGQGAGVTNIEITDDNIKSFERVVRKFGTMSKGKAGIPISAQNIKH